MLKLTSTVSRHDEKMATTNNHATVSNQVGSQQLVHGSLYFGPVSNIFQAAGPDDIKDETQVRDKDVLSSLAFREMLDRRNDIEEPHHGTCQWIFQLEDFKDWHTRTHGLLWIKGKPGAGKSTLMSLLYHKLRERHSPDQGVCLDFFFNARGTELQHTQQGMLRSLLNQIFRQDDSVRPAIKRIYHEKNTAFGHAGQNGDWQWQIPELKRLLSEVVITSAQHQQVTIFIDALDEAGNHPAREIIQFIHQLNGRAKLSSAALKICISCRHYPVSCHIKGVEITVEDYNHQDIQTYIHDSLRPEYCTGIDELAHWRALETAILDRSQGIFQWVRLVMPILLKEISELGSPRDAIRRLDQVPQQLEDVYIQILCDTIGPQYRKQSFILFEWVYAAKVPIHAENLGHILDDDELILQDDDQAEPQVTAVNEKRKKRVKTYSGGLIEIVSIKNSYVYDFVQVIHQTVRDFLTIKGLSLLALLQKEAAPIRTLDTMELDQDDPIKHCHATIYWRCLTYLGAALSVPYFEVDKPSRSPALPKFTLYASSFLFQHAAEAFEHRSKDLEHETTLLRKIFPHAMFIRANNLNFSHASRVGRGSTLLHILATTNLVDLIAYVLKSDLSIDVEHSKSTELSRSVDVTDLYGRSPFFVASGLCRRQACEIFLRAGADIDLMTYDGWSPLAYLTSDDKCTGFIGWLLENGATVDQDIRDLGTALMEAIRHGNHSIVMRLISAGANVNGVSDLFYTPLQVAVFRNRRGIVKTLLDAGACVNSQVSGLPIGPSWLVALLWGKDSRWVRELHYNRSHFDERFVESTSLDGYPAPYSTALSIAALRMKDASMMKLLLKAGADTNVKYMSRSLMQSVVDANRFDLARLLLSYGAVNDTHWKPVSSGRGRRS